MEKHAFERQARTRKRPQTGSRVYGWWEFNEIYVERRGISRCIDVLRVTRMPGVPRATKE